jgi:hypothetical protein
MRFDLREPDWPRSVSAHGRCQRSRNSPPRRSGNSPWGRRAWRTGCGPPTESGSWSPDEVRQEPNGEEDVSDDRSGRDIRALGMRVVPRPRLPTPGSEPLDAIRTASTCCHSPRGAPVTVGNWRALTSMASKTSTTVTRTTSVIMFFRLAHRIRTVVHEMPDGSCDTATHALSSLDERIPCPSPMTPGRPSGLWRQQEFIASTRSVTTWSSIRPEASLSVCLPRTR